MLITVRQTIAKKFIDLLSTSGLFKKHFVVLYFGKSYVIRRTKPVEELLKIKITEENILSLKFDYHSSFNILKEHIAEISKHNYEEQRLLLSIWTSEERVDLIKTAVLDLTTVTNEKIKTLLAAKVFNEKYGSGYNYYISLFMNPDIKKVKDDNRMFSEITLKYSLRPDNKENEMRLKTKFDITKKEAKSLCSIISYWKATTDNL